MIKNYINVLKALISECSNWPSIIFAKVFNFKLQNILLRNKIKLFMGNKIGKADLSMFSEIWHEEYYNPQGFEINEKDIIFDIGANSGFFTVYAASKAPQGKVYAFEPVPHLVQKIKMTISLNNLKNVQVENLAVGNNNPESTFYISKNHNGCHSLYKRDTEMDKITVPVVKLEKFCADNYIQKINFLKLDCEGAEYEILNNQNIDFIRKTIDKISMEYHDDINIHTHQEIIDTLNSANFTVKLSKGYIYAKNKNI